MFSCTSADQVDRSCYPSCFAASPNFSSLLAESIKICLAAVLSRGWAPHLRRLGFFGKRKPHLPELIVCSPAR